MTPQEAIRLSSPFAERRACPFCARESSELVTRIRYHETVGADLELPDVDGALLACRPCGIAYPSHVYSLEQFVHISSRLIERQIVFHRSWVPRARRLLLREILRRRGARFSPSELLDAATRHALLVPLFERRQAPSRVLDVGAGFGDFAEAFRALGDGVETTEVVDRLVEHLRGIGFPSHLGELEKLGLEPGSFDLVFMRGTLYRTRDPARTLETARDLLAAGGRIALLDPCPGAEGAEYFARMQFPQGQFYILDRERYASLLPERFGLVLDRQRLIYGRPETHLRKIGILGTAVEFAEMFANNLLRRKPFVLAYSLRRVEPGDR